MVGLPAMSGEARGRRGSLKGASMKRGNSNRALGIPRKLNVVDCFGPKFRNRYIVSMIVALFLIHATVTKQSLRLFTCTEIKSANQVAADQTLSATELMLDAASSSGSSTSTSSAVEAAAAAPSRRFLQFDLDVSCDEPLARGFMLFVGLPFFILYAIGIPFLAFLLLFYRRRRLDHPKVRERYGFLFSGFRKPVFFWESVVMLRKVGLAAVSVFLAPWGVELQTYFALLIVAIATFLHARFWPYTKESVNRLDFAALIVAFLTLVGGLFLQSSKSSTAAKTLTTMLLLIINILLMIVMIVFLFNSIRRTIALSDLQQPLQRLRSTLLKRRPAITSGPGASQRITLDPMQMPTTGPLATVRSQRMVASATREGEATTATVAFETVRARTGRGRGLGFFATKQRSVRQIANALLMARSSGASASTTASEGGASGGDAAMAALDGGRVTGAAPSATGAPALIVNPLARGRSRAPSDSKPVM